MNGEFNVQVVVQLWQVCFAFFMGCVTLLSVGFAAATIFVRRAECRSHGDNTAKALNELFSLIRNLADDVSFLKGMAENDR
jgi:hypothetical protein